MFCGGVAANGFLRAAVQAAAEEAGAECFVPPVQCVCACRGREEGGGSLWLVAVLPITLATTPPYRWCTDNGTMVAWAGACMAAEGTQGLQADEVDFQQRMPFGRELTAEELQRCRAGR